MNKKELIAAINQYPAAPKGLSRMPKGDLIKLLAVIKHEAEKTPAVPSKKREYKTEAGAKQADSMKATMKIENRAIAEVDEEGAVLGEWDNCNQLYKAGEVTASQGDTISGKIFGALRRGGAAPVVVLRDGRRFVYAS